jgi:hypothetical protein
VDLSSERPEGNVDWTYRMLGSEHEVDLEREARKWQHADEVRGRRRKQIRVLPARLIALVVAATRIKG